MIFSWLIFLNLVCSGNVLLNDILFLKQRLDWQFCYSDGKSFFHKVSALCYYLLLWRTVHCTVIVLFVFIRSTNQIAWSNTSTRLIFCLSNIKDKNNVQVCCCMFMFSVSPADFLSFSSSEHLVLPSSELLLSQCYYPFNIPRTKSLWQLFR